MLGWLGALLAGACSRWRIAQLFRSGLVGGEGLILEGRVELTHPERVRLGRRVRLGVDVYMAVWPEGRLEIGDDSYIGRRTIILAHQQVCIGRDSLIAPECHITDVNHGMEAGQSIRTQPLHSRPIRIGNDVWIGAGCSILPGVTIGDGAVIGARAAVTRDIPPMAIAVGVPARVIRYRSGAEGLPRDSEKRLPTDHSD